MFSPFALLISLVIGSAASAAEVNDGRCGGAADESFICGPVNAEDLRKIPGTDWVIASHMAGPGGAEGSFYLLNAKNHSWWSVDMDSISAAANASAYPACPGRPTSASFPPCGRAWRS